MKLKLDLHPIFSDSRKIEQSLVDIIMEAVDKKATEVEIIPGKGSGALKKSVLRFLERPEIKSQYHRVEKDDENFGRVFVHFRFDPEKHRQPVRAPKIVADGQCFCCQASISLDLEETLEPGQKIVQVIECESCGSPNKLAVVGRRDGKLNVSAESGYEAEL